MEFSKWIPSYFGVVSERSSAGQDLVFLKQQEDILRPWLREGMRLLDVGCATGYAYYNYAKYGVDYYGIDIVSDYIEEGRKHLSRHGLSPDHLQVTDLYDFSSRADRYDLVVCNTVLQHLDKPEAAVAALSSLTKTVLLIRTITGDRDIIRKTKCYQDTTLPWDESLQSETGVSFNVYSKDGLADKLRSYFPAVEIIADLYTTQKPVSLFANEYYSHSIYKCVR